MNNGGGFLCVGFVPRTDRFGNGPYILQKIEPSHFGNLTGGRKIDKKLVFFASKADERLTWNTFI
jgi:hypothetical protein